MPEIPLSEVGVKIHWNRPSSEKWRWCSHLSQGVSQNTIVIPSRYLLDFPIADTVKKNGSTSGKIMFDRGANGQVCSKGEGASFVSNLTTLLWRQQIVLGNPAYLRIGGNNGKAGP